MRGSQHSFAGYSINLIFQEEKPRQSGFFQGHSAIFIAIFAADLERSWGGGKKKEVWLKWRIVILLLFMGFIME